MVLVRTSPEHPRRVRNDRDVSVRGYCAFFPAVRKCGKALASVPGDLGSLWPGSSSTFVLAVEGCYLPPSMGATVGFIHQMAGLVGHSIHTVLLPQVIVFFFFYKV